MVEEEEMTINTTITQWPEPVPETNIVGNNTVQTFFADLAQQHTAAPGTAILDDLTVREVKKRTISDEKWFLLNRLVPDFPQELPVTDFFVTGSAYVCDPPVNDTDVDVAIMIRPLHPRDVRSMFEAAGWTQDGKGYEGTGFMSFRKDIYNLIVNMNLHFFKSLQLYTQVAKVLNIKDKAQRIMLATAIRDGEFKYEPEKYAKKASINNTGRGNDDEEQGEPLLPF